MVSEEATTSPFSLSVKGALSGKRFFITGATGFLGTALVERLLRSVPDCSVVLLVRPGRRASAEARARREVLRNDCFDRLREELGDDFDSMVEERFKAVAGDVSIEGLGMDDEGLRALAECDVVVHCAAAVAFDAPLDTAVEVNLVGPSRVAAAMTDARLRHTDARGAHLVSVSTAYVAGTHQGEATETLATDVDTATSRARTHTTVTTEVNIDAEVRFARRLRADLQAESRRTERLERFTSKARAELGSAGMHLLAERAEKLREEWVRAELVEQGRKRAQSLGWPDAYAFTKALGERMLVQSHPQVPTTVVRPSIIESSLNEPRPGWIRGFRMAEPIIISYARGLLREFPGIPEGVIDVIPVDMVTAAILAAAASGPDPERTAVFHVASSVRNPLLYGRLQDLAESWFNEHPLYDTKGAPIAVPKWSLPGRGRVQQQLRRASKVLVSLEQALSSLPLRGERAELAARIEDRRSEVDRALSYVELYGSYAETEARFRVDHLLELYNRLTPEDAREFCFDPGTIDWDHYVQEVHLPSIVEHARVRSTPGKTKSLSRSERARRALLSPDRQLAAFDLENTLIASNVVESYAWLASRHLPVSERAVLTGRILRDAPTLLALDRRDRGDFLRHFYRRYEGAPAALLRRDSVDLFNQLLLPKSFPEGFARLRAHKQLGHRTVLITGALDFVVEPLRPLFDEIVCAQLEVDARGRLTGGLERLPPTGEARALMLAEYAASEGLDLAEAIAYADSASDLPLLECVGFPVAVNPESRLAAIARRRGWHTELWQKASGNTNPPLPMGPVDTGVSRWWARAEGIVDRLTASVADDADDAARKSPALAHRSRR